MELRRLVETVVVAVIVGISTVAGAAETPLGLLNVKDFGAKGDGVADDTAAIQQAIDRAGKASPDDPAVKLPPGVFFPAGTYRVTKTIVINREHELEQLVGVSKGYTTLKYDGEAGQHLLDLVGCKTALKTAELKLNGSDKADVLMRINSVLGVGTGLLYFERVDFSHARAGVEIGKDFDSCASDMTIVDCNFSHLTDVGFRTCNGQNVDYVFIRCVATWVPLGFHFMKGGNAHFILPCVGRVRTGIKIDVGGINGGVYTITGLQQETFSYDNEKKRFTTLDVQSECNVSISGIYTGCGNVWGDDADVETPNFIIGPSAQVTIRDSMISGKIAKLTGAPKNPATWLQFENCRFRCAADPRVDIEADQYSGYEFRNCHVTVDNITSKLPKREEGVLLIRRLTKVPEQVKVIGE